MADYLIRNRTLTGWSIDDLGYGLLWLCFALGFLVMVEPAPFDLSILALGGLTLIMGLRIPGSLSPLIVLCVVILLCGFIALTQTKDLADSSMHMIITCYLMVIMFIVASATYTNPDRGLKAILGGHAAAAVISAALGIIGYFNLMPGTHELFTEYGRAKGAFKDPNVFGPFLIVGGIYALQLVLTRPLAKGLIWLAMLLVVVLGLFLSFSRGAWGHFALSTLICVVLLVATSRDRAFNLRIIFLGICAIVIFALAIVAALNLPGVSEMLSVRAGLNQSYDSGGSGRFDGQALAIRWILAAPLGYGQDDFGYFWGEQPHNVYLYMFLQTGWLGGVAYIALVVGSIVGILRMVFSTTPWRGYAIVLASTFIPLALEGLIVDTDHWRHFWMLIGMIWGLIAWHRDWNVSMLRRGM